MNCSHESCSALSLLGSALLLCAGSAAQGLGVWEDRARLAVARQEVGQAVHDGKVYVTGGLGLDTRAIASVERLDPLANTWTRVADMPTTLHHHGMASAGGLLYVVGGYVAGFTGTAAVRAYDPVTNQWSSRAPLPRPRGALAAVEIGGKIYAVGGVVPGVGVVGELTVYDPAQDRWATLTPMPTPREHLGAAAIDGKLYVAGGRTGSLFATLEIYDPASGRWSTGRPMPTARGGNGAAALLGRLIVFGGEASANFPQAEEYDPVTDTWRTLTPMSTPLHGIYPVAVGDEIIFAGGGLVPGYGATDLTLAFHYERPLADCRVTPASVGQGQPFTYEVALANLGRTRPVDLYLGYVSVARGVFALYRSDLALLPAPPFTPSLGALFLPENLVIPLTPLASHPGSVLGPGAHYGIVALTAAGAFLDGRIDPGDVLAVDVSPIGVR
jgi:hypothetical protein